MSSRSEQEIRQSIEASRARMGETVEEIGARVNPDRVQRELKARARDEVDEFKANVKQKARSTMRDLEHEAEEKGRGMWRTIKDNPVPATMVGVGLAWLMANGSTSDDDGYARSRMDLHGPAEPYRPGYARAEYPPQYRDDLDRGYDAGSRRPMARTRAEIAVGGAYGEAEYDEDEHGVRERAEELTDEARERGAEALDTARERGSEAMEAARERGSEAVDTARERGSEAMEAARDKTAELGHRGREQARHVRHKAGEWSDQVQHKARRAEHRVEDAVRDNPLAAGAMAAALGFAAGLMVPETQREHEMLGSTRDRVLDRAQRSAMSAADKARETAKEKAGDAARKAVDSAFSDGDGDTAGGREDAMTEPGRG